jgi:hypothetical protein
MPVVRSRDACARYVPSSRKTWCSISLARLDRARRGKARRVGATAPLVMALGGQARVRRGSARCGGGRSPRGMSGVFRTDGRSRGPTPRPCTRGAATLGLSCRCLVGRRLASRVESRVPCVVGYARRPGAARRWRRWAMQRKAPAWQCEGSIVVEYSGRHGCSALRVAGQRVARHGVSGQGSSWGRVYRLGRAWHCSAGRGFASLVSACQRSTRQGFYGIGGTHGCSSHPDARAVAVLGAVG